MKYLSLFLLLINLNAFSQTYRDQIAAHREGYKEDFLKDDNSPLKKSDLKYLRFYDADSSYLVEAKAEFSNNPSAFIMPVFSGTKGSEYIAYATLKLTLNGQPIELTVYRSTRLAKLPQYKDYLFLPFTDETNGKTTYEGGRYIDLRESDFKENTVFIDFNKAYNPYCAFGGGYACPKPPENNHIKLPVTAGEQRFAKAH